MKRYCVFIFISLVLFSFGSAEQFISDSINFNNPSFNDYYSSSSYISQSEFWPILQDMKLGNCEAVTDFTVMIPPGGCTPAVVRSDLLASQNVPVFCRLEALQLNPLIKVSAIKSLSFSGDYPKEVAAVRFHPANAGAGIISNTLLNNPVINNIGYAVIILKQTPNESSMEKWISGNLTARMSYDAEKAFGLGASDFYLEQVDDSQWESKSSLSSFLMGRGFARLMDVRSDSARIKLYLDGREREVTLREGETSNTIYLPGFYCMAGFKVRLNEVVSEEDMALLRVGEDSLWVRQGSKILNGRCRVESININSAEIGSVKLNCQGGKAELILSGAYSANLSIEEGNKILNLGDKVIEGNSTNPDWYVGFIDAKSNSKINDQRLSYVVLVSQRFGTTLDGNKISRLREGLEKMDKIHLTYKDFNNFVSEISRNSGLKNGTDFIAIQEKGNSIANKKGVTFNGIEESDLSSRSSSNLGMDVVSQVNGNYTSYDEAVQNLIDFFPQTKSPNLDDRYAEKALLEEIYLTQNLVGRNIKTEFDLNELREKFLRLYPDSSYANRIRLELDGSTIYDRSNASVVVESNGDIYRISLDSLKRADPTKQTAEILVNGISYGRLGLYVEKNISSITGDKFWITKIEKNRVTIEYFEYKDGTYSSNQFTIVSDEEKTNIGRESNYTFLARDIDTNQVAHVSLIPEQSNARTEANFTFKIGIEKRAFEITSEKANKKLEKLNKTIEQWEKRLDSLGKLVEGWKKVCFFTGLGLQAKNLVTGFSGEALARQEVMKVYRDICDRDREGVTNPEIERSECYNRLKGNIENDVKAYKDAINKANNEVLKKYKTIEQWRNSSDGKKLKITTTVNGESIELSAEDFSNWDDIRAYYLNENLRGNGNVGDRAKIDFDKRVESMALEKKRIEKTNEGNKELEGIFGSGALSHNSDEKTVMGSITGRKIKDIPNQNGLELDTNTPLEIIPYDNTNYLAVVKYSGAGEYIVDTRNVYQWNSTERSWEKVDLDSIGEDDPKKGLLNRLVSYGFTDNGNYKNNYTSPVVRYFKDEPNKGRPAIVPFDLDNGWYVKVSQASGGLLSDEVQGYQESGTVRFFYICNVGVNGREENMGGDDICQSFDVNSYNKVDHFRGYRGVDVKRLGDDALDAIRQASRAYQSVKTGAQMITISIRGKTLNLKVDSDYSGDSPIGECTDFMSVNECNLLFNVCDPVICPSSRCDFGGKMPVDNVIASGVAGSLLLCLPNFGNPTNGSVAVPICLTGLHAGLDGWLSILKAKQACLIEAERSGKYVGVCDYITSIYKCEFFWRNAQPLMRNLVPKVVELISDPSSLFRTRGGGEYLTFQKSWDNLDSSMNNFKNIYAGTSFVGAMNYSNVEEFGSEVCRQFIGTSFPTKGKAFDAMFKPDSPTQFYAEFHEIPYTEATVPPTSQYKVLYHIYAGNDMSTSYQVYLKDPPASAQYQNNPEMFIASGVIGQGKFASESKTFTAPQGYKQLCVVLNGVEKCGFKQVSSDVGLEMLTKAQVANEAGRTDITTESQCISGSSSVLGMGSSLNLEAGAASSLTPEIYQMGIVRVCATENPGKGVNDNWISVGYCGDPNLKCWLDNSSINRNTIGIFNAVKTIEGTEEIQKNLNSIYSAMTEEDSNLLAIQIESDLKNQGAVDSILNNNITKLENEGYYDYHQARGYYLRTLFYKIRIEELLDDHSTRNSLNANIPIDGSSSKSSEEKESIYLFKNLREGEEVKVNGIDYIIISVDQSALTFREKNKPGTPKICRFENKNSFNDCVSR